MRTSQKKLDALDVAQFGVTRDALGELGQPLVEKLQLTPIRRGRGRALFRDDGAILNDLGERVAFFHHVFGLDAHRTFRGEPAPLGCVFAFLALLGARLDGRRVDRLLELARALGGLLGLLLCCHGRLSFTRIVSPFSANRKRAPFPSSSSRSAPLRSRSARRSPSQGDSTLLAKSRAFSQRRFGGACLHAMPVTSRRPSRGGPYGSVTIYSS